MEKRRKLFCEYGPLAYEISLMKEALKKDIEDYIIKRYKIAKKKSYENYEYICQNILAEFDKDVVRYFNEADVEKGYLEVENRKGVMEQFPLTSVSVGVLVAERGRFANILEIGEVSTQVKHLAKSIPGSSYAIDRRKSEND